MKRFFVLTLTALFATVALFLTNLFAFNSDSDSGYKIAGNVYGEAYVCTWYEAPYAKSSHSVSVSNEGPGDVKYYGIYEAYVSGNGWKSDKKKGNDEEMVPINGFKSSQRNFSFNMSRRGAGHYTIFGKTDLKVRDDVNDTTVWWKASCNTIFERQ